MPITKTFVRIDPGPIPDYFSRAIRQGFYAAGVELDRCLRLHA
jgi:hypothetical protein